ncbi:Las1-like protein [Gracilaria domingensis]|nr:Las1-like protein [Gracilaria domingensis]
MGVLPDGTRVLPWANWSEWLELKDMLTIGEIEQAKARVALYQVRRRGSVPISILSSVALASQLKNPSPDPYTQRLGLSMTITRFVNGLTDRLQPRGQGASARSVHKLAKELGLPLTLVDIRHQSCHNLLPRLSALESGAKQALFWLERFYWKPQHSNIACHLPKVFTDIQKVFRDTVEQTRRGEEFESALLLLNALDAENDDVCPVVHKMRKITKRIEDRRELSVVQTPITKRKSGSKRWRRCGNPDVWKHLSFGLIPGQKRPPRLRKIDLRLARPLQTGECLSDVPCDEHVPLVSRKNHQLSSGESVQQQPSDLTAEEAKKMTSLTDHFRSLVSSQPVNTAIAKID